jgi:hypothetical protein
MLSLSNTRHSRGLLPPTRMLIQPQERRHNCL